jgi:hypothetical protein
MIGNPDPLPLGYSLDPDAPPGTYDHLDAYPGTNLHQNLENMFKNSFEEMINNFELSNHGAAEVIATKLLQWGNLNVVHRSLVHIVSHPLSKTCIRSTTDTLVSCCHTILR